MEEQYNDFLENICRNIDKDSLIDAMKENIEKLKRHEIPITYPNDIKDMNGLLMLSMQGIEFMRESIISLSAFPLIAKDWIKVLAEYLHGEKCVEIMAGSGMLTYALKEMGIDIIATDNGEWEWEHKWTEVKQMDYQESIKCYMKECSYLILSWPEMGENADYALRLMRKENPKAKMVYIGEFGGCCANQEFVDAARIVDREWICKINENFVNWAGIHDKVFILK